MEQYQRLPRGTTVPQWSLAGRLGGKVGGRSGDIFRLKAIWRAPGSVTLCHIEALQRLAACAITSGHAVTG